MNVHRSPIYTVFKIPDTPGYHGDFRHVICDTPPALPPSAKDSAPDHGIWVTLPGSGDQRASTDDYSWSEICENSQGCRVCSEKEDQPETQVTQFFQTLSDLLRLSSITNVFFFC